MARAASTGGGKTYRGQMPINWYASLVIIVIAGLLLVGYSRYQRTHKVNNSSGAPTTTQTWHAALAIDICGTIEPNLPTSTNTNSAGLTADGNGLVIVSPKNSSESGANATLGKFVSEYKGLTLSSNTLGYPGKKVDSNGATCPKGTPDAGKQGYVNSVQWTNYLAKKSTDVQGNPTSLKFSDGQMITLAFLPATASVPKPPGTVVTSLINAVQSGATTSTTAPSTAPIAPTTATTAPTATTAAPTATTAAPTATTAAP